MAGMIELERAAEKLRRYLRLAPLPDLKALCAFRFFETLAQYPEAIHESYLREFFPELAEIIARCRPGDFLPEEIESLERMIKLLESHPIATEPVPRLLEDFNHAITENRGLGDRATSDTKTTRVDCLFIEYNPDLDLPPRGRLLELEVAAESISAKKEADDIVIRNPVEEPDDRFVAQARDSVAAARKYLLEKFGLPLKKRYRFDFRINTTGARLTGDSLGVAMAVGAIVAVSRVEIFREKLTVAPEASFSGALTPEGALTPIDTEGLKLKIYRAFHTGTKYLVIPRTHITEAWDYLSQLEKVTPSRRLELLGADTLETIVADPRLVQSKRYSLPAYAANIAWKKKRTQVVEIPALIILSLILFVLVAPARWMPWFDNNPYRAAFNYESNKLEVLNDTENILWTVDFPYRLHEIKGIEYVRLFDLNKDGYNEVIFMPPTKEGLIEHNFLFAYDHDGAQLFKRDCQILGEYPNDTPGVIYSFEYLNIIPTTKGPIIITEMATSIPARSHIRLWKGDGDPLGWYVNAGGSWFNKAFDINSDGSLELLFLNHNNRLNRASLLVLNPDSVWGVSPPYTDSSWDLSWVKKGSQIAYITFPRTDIGYAMSHLAYNQPSQMGISVTDISLFCVNVTEFNQGEVLYYINRNLRVVSIILSDQFRKGRQDNLDRFTNLSQLPMDSYAQLLLDSVMYRTDSGWVSEKQLREAEAKVR